MLSSKDYWRKRKAQELMYAEYREITQVEEKLSEQYKKASKSINKDLVSINTIESEAQRIKKLKENIEAKIDELKDNTELSSKKLLEQEYEDAFYKTTFGIQQQVGYGSSFSKLNENAVKNAVEEKWLGENFSSRVWRNKIALKKSLEENIPKSIIKGESVDEISKKINEELYQDFWKTRRLVRTELNNIYNKGTKDAYVESEAVEEYEYLSTLDGRTSDICSELDGKKFKVNESMPGENYPPMHPNCRSTTIAVIDGKVYEERIARGDDGVYKVPGDMKYKDWYEKYVGGAPINSENVNNDEIENMREDVRVEGKELRTYTTQYQDFDRWGEITNVPKQQTPDYYGYIKGKASSASEIRNRMSMGKEDVANLLYKNDAHPLLKQIYVEKGYDQLPKIVSKKEMDELVKDGKRPDVYRSFTSSQELGTSFTNSKEFAEQFKKGDYFAGDGIFGNGSYGVGTNNGLDYTSSISNQYRGFDLQRDNNPDGSTVRFTFDENAKILSGNIRALNYNTMPIEEMGFDKDFLEEIKFAKENGLEWALDPDNFGEYCALRGYDAIYVPSEDYYIGLNRSAMIMQEELVDKDLLKSWNDNFS